MLKQITVVGGTHGNEWLGPVLIKKLEQEQTFHKSRLPVSTLKGNPWACDANTRFIDRDLNRCFTRKILFNSDGSYYEYIRAREIYQLLGTESSVGNFVIDLHSTTSNMGLTLLVCKDDQLSLQAGTYVQMNMPDVRLIVSDRKLQFSGTLSSLTGLGITVEIGPVPHCVVRTDLLEASEKIVCLLVEFLELASQGIIPALPYRVETFQFRERVPYPQDYKGQISAYIHQDLQDRDFQQLQNGDSVFQGLNGQPISYTGQPGFPIFINEAAYYQKNIAFIMTDKVTMIIRQKQS